MAAVGGAQAAASLLGFGAGSIATVSSFAAGVVRDAGYLGLGLMMVAENLFPPIPSEVILPLAGYAVGRGELTFWLALTVATAGSVTGAALLYAFGRFAGAPAARRYGRLIRVDEKRLRRAERWFERRGDAAVLLARLIPGLRSAISVPAGLLRMPLGRYLALTTIGSTAWNAALIGAGVWLGSRWTAVSATVESLSVVVYIALAAAAVVLAWVVAGRRRSARSGGAGTS